MGIVVRVPDHDRPKVTGDTPLAKGLSTQFRLVSAVAAYDGKRGAKQDDQVE